MQTQRHYILNLLLILAFVSAGISPACQFINGGKSLIEICTADGTIKTIEVAFNDAPQAPLDAPENHKYEQDCSFCFAQSHLKTKITDGNTLTLALHGAYLKTGSGSLTFKSTAQSSFDARGPPRSFS